MREGARSGRLRATSSADEAVMASACSLICVGTPSHGNGNLDLTPNNGRYCAGDGFSVQGGIVQKVIGMDPGSSHCKLGPFEEVPEKSLPQQYRR